MSVIKVPVTKKRVLKTEFTLSESMSIRIVTDYGNKSVKVIHKMKDGRMAIGIMSSPQDIRNLTEALNELIK